MNIKILFAMIIMCGMVLASGWYDNDWGHAQNITINSSYIDATLTDFPILVTLNATNLDFDDIHEDGDDFRFTTANNDTVLDYEIEYIDDEDDEEEVVIWVEVPSISHTTDTVIIMYYDNDEASAGEDIEGTWNSGYDAVWHFGETGTGLRYDSTSNNNDATPQNYVGTEKVDYTVKYGDDVDGISKYLTISPIEYNTDDEFTISFYAHTDDSSNGMILGKLSATSSFIWMGGSSSKSRFRTIEQTNFELTNYTSYTTPRGYWFTSDEESLSYYVDGVFQQSQSGTPSIYINSLLYAYVTPSTYALKGSADEIRLSNVERTEAYIKGEYHSVKTSDFISISDAYTNEVPTPPLNTTVTTSVDITPSTPTTFNNLSCAFESTYTANVTLTWFNDDVSHSTTIYNNTIINTTYTNTIEYNNTNSGELWRCNVDYVFSDDSTSNDNSTVTIIDINTTVTTSVDITPSTPSYLNDLNCNFESSHGADVTLTWLINGTVTHSTTSYNAITINNTYTNTIKWRNTTSNENWTCKIEFDYEIESITINDTITISENDFLDLDADSWITGLVEDFTLGYIDIMLAIFALGVLFLTMGSKYSLISLSYSVVSLVLFFMTGSVLFIATGGIALIVGLVIKNIGM